MYHLLRVSLTGKVKVMSVYTVFGTVRPDGQTANLLLVYMYIIILLIRSTE